MPNCHYEDDSPLFEGVTTPFMLIFVTDIDLTKVGCRNHVVRKKCSSYDDLKYNTHVSVVYHSVFKRDDEDDYFVFNPLSPYGAL